MKAPKTPEEAARNINKLFDLLEKYAAAQNAYKFLKAFNEIRVLEFYAHQRRWMSVYQDYMAEMKSRTSAKLTAMFKAKSTGLHSQDFADLIRSSARLSEANTWLDYAQEMNDGS